MTSFLRAARQGLNQNKGDVLALGFLAAWPFFYFWPAALNRAVFYFGDILYFFYPTHLVYANALREGRLPLWEPQMLDGFPLYAEGQIGALNPLHLLLYRFLPVGAAINDDILIHVALIAIGTYLFARTLKLHPASAFLAAMAFGTGGFILPRLQHMSVLATAAWMPWILWAWEKREQETDRKKRWGWFVLLTLFSAMQLLSGHPQFALMTALLVALYAVVRWPRQPVNVVTSPFNGALFVGATKTNPGIPQTPRDSAGPPRQGRCKFVTTLRGLFFEYFDPLRLIPVICFFGLGALLAAVQLLPTFELAGLSYRAGGLNAKLFNAFSLRPAHYLLMLDPFLLGNPLPNVSVEVIGYIGLVPLALALAAPLIRRDRRVFFFLLVAFVGLFLGLGDRNIFYRGLRYLPLFSYFRVPSRFFFWVTFALAMLAAITLDYFLTRAQETTHLTRGQKVLLLSFTVLIAVVVGLVPVVPVETWLSIWVWLPVVLACFAAWIVLGARRGLFTRTALIGFTLGITVLDLALFAAVYAKTYDMTTPVDDFYQPPRSLAALQGLSPQEGRVLTSLWVTPWIQAIREIMYPNTSMLYGVSSAIGYTPLLVSRVTDYTDHMTAQMMNLSNVRYYLKPQLLPVDPQTEGEDMLNEFAPEYVGHPMTFAPIPANKLVVISSLAQSVDWPNGHIVAQIALVTQDGEKLTLPLEAGNDTAEWAYERSDVRQAVKHSMPPVATTFPASSSFPEEAHPGHNYLAQFDLTRAGQAQIITGITITPSVPSGLIHIEKMVFTGPDGKDVSLAHLVGQSDQTLVYRTQDVAIFQNPDALPRAFLVHDAHLANDDATLQELTQDTYKPQETLILANGAELHAGGAQMPDESAQITTYQPERVVVSVHSNADAYLLLTDTWYPGWTARVDGVETPIQRADLIFRAVRVGAGTHQIEFDYHPASFFNGATISIAAALILAGITVGQIFRICP